MLSDAAEAAGVFVTFALADVEDAGAYEVRFSADDKVCELTTIVDATKVTTSNSAVNPWAPTFTAAVGTTAATCTGKGTEFTTATGWEVVAWGTLPAVNS